MHWHYMELGQNRQFVHPQVLSNGNMGLPRPSPSKVSKVSAVFEKIHFFTLWAMKLVVESIFGESFERKKILKLVCSYIGWLRISSSCLRISLSTWSIRVVTLTLLEITHGPLLSFGSPWHFFTFPNFTSRQLWVSLLKKKSNLFLKWWGLLVSFWNLTHQDSQDSCRDGKKKKNDGATTIVNEEFVV